MFTKKGFFAVFALFASFAPPAEAQNWDFDARTIAIGGVSGSATLASGMIERDATYQSIVLPFGLLQVLPDLGAFDPDSEHFDPVRAVEHAASPIHFIVDRDPAGHGRFASTIATARFYAGQPAASAPTRVDLGGVATSSWGGTIRLSGAQRRDVHGVYVGAGPYVTGRGAADINPQVIAGLDDDSRSIPSSPLTLMTTFSEEQVAIAVTGGYRGRYALPFRDDAAARDGIYVAVNYDYLIGVQYLADDMAVRVDPAALIISRLSSGHGRGNAVDFGAGVVLDRWEFGAGVNGIGNRITWTSVTAKTILFGNVLSGGPPLNPGVAAPRPDVEVSVPVDARANVTYRGDGWLAAGEAGTGIAGRVAHGGVERRVVRGIDVRGGLSYSYGEWNPTGGIGIALGRRAALDLAAFGTSANFERSRKLALAASVRVLKS
ncbi:MAG TPA: hypothetical protein VKD69_09660 [Vicinamibacterales bacterium]|nr:hypothetical protein [Vicinamibacterales bacterium]